MEIVQVKNWARVKPTSREDWDHITKDLILSNSYDDSQLVLWNEHEDGTIDVPIEFLSPPRLVESKDWLTYPRAFKGVLQPKQRGLVHQWLQATTTKNGSIIKAPTGSGKTVMACYIMALLGYKTLVIVPTDYLMTQWREQIPKFLNIQPEEIGICRQNVCDYLEKQVTIGMIHSLAVRNKYPKRFYDEFGLVIVDEVHKLAAPTFSQSLPQFWSKKRLGLSATPKRKDGYENVFKYHIGQICNEVSMEAIKPDVVILKYRNPDTDHHGCVYGGSLSLGKYYNRVAGVGHRNRVIAKVVLALRKKNHEVLVLSDRLGQLDCLRMLLKEDNIANDDIGTFTGTKKTGLDRPIILATYGSAGLGADIPRLTSVVFATPRVDVEQAMGRVLRETKDRPQVVVDIVDVSSSIMEKWGWARLNFYKKKAGKITFKEVNA
jgi:superfamily II DNA or RNA helicase